MKKIDYIEILKNSVYIEYSDGDIQYLSFTKAKQIIRLLNQKQFNFYCFDNEKSNLFLNSLLTHYKISNNLLILR